MRSQDVLLRIPSCVYVCMIQAHTDNLVSEVVRQVAFAQAYRLHGNVVFQHTETNRDNPFTVDVLPIYSCILA